MESDLMPSMVQMIPAAILAFPVMVACSRVYMPTVTNYIPYRTTKDIYFLVLCDAW